MEIFIGALVFFMGLVTGMILMLLIYTTRGNDDG